MVEASEGGTGSRRGLLHFIIGILVFGSIWGFLEATLGGFLHMVIFPNKGAIMGGIGVAIMGTALAIYRKPAMLPGIGIVAASFKLLNVWLLFIPINAFWVINPAIAIIFESLAFCLVAAFVSNRMARNVFAGVAAGASVGLVTAVAFAYLAVYVTGFPFFERMGVGSIAQFIAGQGLVQAAFFAILAPVGYLVGTKLAARTFSVSINRPALYYVTSAAVVCLCWGISAIVVMAGL